jgi:hypothetical protein
MLDHARQNYDFFVQHGPGFTMRVSFLASGSAKYEGQGYMEESWLDNGHKRWTAEVGGSTSGRLVYMGHRWALGNSPEIPIRVQMVRSAFYWPVKNVKPRADLRVQQVSFNGEAITCVLAADKLGFPTPGRHWKESEYCVDPKTGLLRIWSEAPGIYTVYDYKNPVSFRGHVIASEITFYEGAAQVLQIHVESIADAPINPEEFRPSPGMDPKSRVPANGGPVRFSVVVADGPLQGRGTVQPVVIHTTLEPNGTMLEPEVLTPVDQALAQRAIAVAQSRCQCHIFPNDQMEALITVEFLSPRQ